MSDAHHVLNIENIVDTLFGKKKTIFKDVLIFGSNESPLFRASDVGKALQIKTLDLPLIHGMMI